MTETIAEVVRDMRGRAEDGRMDRALWARYADRVEEAVRHVLARKSRNADLYPDEKTAWKAYNAIPRAYRSPAPYVEWLFEEVDA